MKGADNIASLQLVTLNKLIEKFPKAPSLLFSNMIGTQQYPSDKIEWEIEYGSAGMTPFVAPGAEAPVVGVDGIGEASAKAAYFKEKMYFDEEFLNDMRKPGTYAEYQTAELKLARGMQKLDWRIQRRREWMCARMFLDGGFTYTIKGGAMFTVHFGVPDSHRIQLTGNDAWNVDHADSNPILDIFDAKQILVDDAGVGVGKVICNTEMIKTLMFKPSFQELLKKSAFGDGDLYKNPTRVIGELLGVGEITIYDDLYEVPAWIGANVNPGDTIIHVSDASDFEVGGTLRFHSMTKINLWEDDTITAVDILNGTVTVANGPTRAYVAGKDRVTMRKKFIADNQFNMITTSADGGPVAEFMEAPYGVERRWGKYADRKFEWDPDGVWIRVQDKGMPVLYNPDTTITIYAW